MLVLISTFILQKGTESSRPSFCPSHDLLLSGRNWNLWSLTSKFLFIIPKQKKFMVINLIECNGEISEIRVLWDRPCCFWKLWISGPWSLQAEVEGEPCWEHMQGYTRTCQRRLTFKILLLNLFRHSNEELTKPIPYKNTICTGIRMNELMSCPPRYSCVLWKVTQPLGQGHHLVHSGLRKRTKGNA